MNEIILVTGATGNVGSNVVKKLVELRAKVRAVVRTKDKAWKIPALGVEVIEADMSRPETLDEAFNGVGKLLIITPFAESMVQQTKNLVELAKKHGVKHIVKISAMGANPNANMLVGRAHGEAEEIIKSSGIPWTLLRPNVFMQNFVNFHGDTIRTKKAFYAPAEKGKVSFVDSRDVSEAAVTVITQPGHEGKIYTLTGPEALEHRGAEHIISGVVGGLVRYYHVEPEEYEKTMRNAGVPEWNINAMLELYRAIREGFMSETTDDVRNLTGHKPRSFTQFSNDYLQEFREK